jgi:arylformamidase
VDPAFYSREYNNRALVPDNERWVAHWVQGSARARATMTCHLDQHYGNASGETIDIFPARKGDGSCMMFIHGGYWRSRDKQDFSFLAPAWVDAGVSLAVENYDLCPSVTVEEIVRQMLRAGRWLWLHAEEYGMDEDRLYVSGHSAGGHLTAMMMAAVWPAFDKRLPKDLFKGGLAISGIYDLQPLVQAPFVNQDLKLDRMSAHRLSPANIPPATTAPLFTAVGGDESDEFKRQSALIAKAWRYAFAGDIPMPGRNHLTVVEELANPESALFKCAINMMCR